MPPVPLPISRTLPACPGEQGLAEAAQPGLLGLGHLPVVGCGEESGPECDSCLISVRAVAAKLLARALAEQLDLPGQVREAVGAAYEQWDGRGWPGALKAGAVPIAARIAQLAEFMEAAHRVSGIAGATALARRRAGKQFDPALAALVCTRPAEIFGGLDAVPAWQAVIAAEPALAPGLSEGQLDHALAAIANFVDLSHHTAAGIRAVFLAARSRGRPGCSRQRTRTSRCGSPGRTGPPGRRAGGRADP